MLKQQQKRGWLIEAKTIWAPCARRRALYSHRFLLLWVGAAGHLPRASDGVQRRILLFLSIGTLPT